MIQSFSQNKADIESNLLKFLKFTKKYFLRVSIFLIDIRINFSSVRSSKIFSLYLPTVKFVYYLLLQLHVIQQILFWDLQVISLVNSHDWISINYQENHFNIKIWGRYNSGRYKVKNYIWGWSCSIRSTINVWTWVLRWNINRYGGSISDSERWGKSIGWFAVVSCCLV